MEHQEGIWHETLRKLRVQLRRGMDGETAAAQRSMGLDYEVNFGVNLLRLREMALELPSDGELADLMWHKNVRELKLLALMIYPEDLLTKTKAIELVSQVSTQEIAEQLVFLRLRKLPFAVEVLDELLHTHHQSAGIQGVIPYLLLNHIVADSALTPERFESLSTVIVGDFSSDDFYNHTIIYNALMKLVDCRPDISVIPICEAVVQRGNEHSKWLATDIIEYSREKQA